MRHKGLEQVGKGEYSRGTWKEWLDNVVATLRVKTLAMHDASERGKNVTITIDFIRHGIREGAALTDEGRQITAQLAKASGVDIPNYNAHPWAVKPIGSYADDKQGSGAKASPVGVPRSAESALIYAKGLVGQDSLISKRQSGSAEPGSESVSRDLGERMKSVRVGTRNFHLREEQRLSYYTGTLPPPYDHDKVYNSALESALKKRGYAALADVKDIQEKEAITHDAQKATLNHVFDVLPSTDGRWAKETAGMFADLIEHYADMTNYLKSRSNVVIPAGTHGGTMEYLLQQALVWTSRDGQQRVGIRNARELEEVGGPFTSSEAYSVTIETDNKGDLILPLGVRFKGPNRPRGELQLDSRVIAECAKLFRDLNEKYQKKDAKIK